MLVDLKSRNDVIGSHRRQTYVLWIADHQPTSTAFPSLREPGISIHSFPAADGRLPDVSLHNLDLGAADFLLRPFTERELLVRLHSVLRRVQGGDPLGGINSEVEWLKGCGALLLNCATRESWLHGKPLDLTGSQFTVLECLVREPCNVVSRDDLAMALYGRHATPHERTIDVHISNLRRKVEALADLRIRTARGTGYFLVPVRGATAQRSSFVA